jgi:release factor glutamine methyltransferase
MAGTIPSPSTVAALLEAAVPRLEAAGSSSARLDAELLLAVALGVDRTGVVAHPGALVGSGAVAAYDGYVTRRAAGEPVAYIRGFREFHGLAIATDPRALIPRPETELLVDQAIATIAARLTSSPRPAGAPPVRVADVGTGSGAIAIAIVSALRKRRMDEHIVVVAVDLSEAALDLARENAVGHGVADRLRFRAGDLLPVGDEPYDLICANLPYVASGDLAALARDLAFEPEIALDGGPDGLDVIRRLLELLPRLLVPDGGVALLEIGADQGASVVDAVDRLLPGWGCLIQPDLAGLPRLARISRSTTTGSAPGRTPPGGAGR